MPSIANNGLTPAEQDELAQYENMERQSSLSPSEQAELAQYENMERQSSLSPSEQAELSQYENMERQTQGSIRSIGSATDSIDASAFPDILSQLKSPVSPAASTATDIIPRPAEPNYGIDLLSNLNAPANPPASTSVIMYPEPAMPNISEGLFANRQPENIAVSTAVDIPRPIQPEIREGKSSGTDRIEILKSLLGGIGTGLTGGAMNYSQDYPQEVSPVAHTIGEFIGMGAPIGLAAKAVRGTQLAEKITNPLLRRILTEAGAGAVYGAGEEAISGAKGEGFNPINIPITGAEWGAIGGIGHGLGKLKKYVKGKINEANLPEIPPEVKSASTMSPELPKKPIEAISRATPTTEMPQKIIIGNQMPGLKQALDIENNPVIIKTKSGHKIELSNQEVVDLKKDLKSGFRSPNLNISNADLKLKFPDEYAEYERIKAAEKKKLRLFNKEYYKPENIEKRRQEKLQREKESESRIEKWQSAGTTLQQSKYFENALKKKGINYKRSGWAKELGSKGNSEYFSIYNKDGEITGEFRFSDHESPVGGGFNVESQNRYGEPDFSVDPITGNTWREAILESEKLSKSLPTDKLGQIMAKNLGVEYNGLQEMPKGRPPLYTFTDPQTKSSFNAETFKEAKPKLEELRKSFEKSSSIPLRPTTEKSGLPKETMGKKGGQPVQSIDEIAKIFMDYGYSKPTAKSRAIIDPIVEYSEGHPGKGLVPWSIQLTKEGTKSLGMDNPFITKATRLHEVAAKYELLKSKKLGLPKEAPAGKLVKSPIAEIIEGKRESSIGMKDFKDRMIAELDKHINPLVKREFKKPEDYQQFVDDMKRGDESTGKNSRFWSAYNSLYEIKGEGHPHNIKISIPGDGDFTISNNLGSLTNLKNKVSKLSGKMIESKVPVSQTGFIYHGKKGALAEHIKSGAVEFTPKEAPAGKLVKSPVERPLVKPIKSNIPKLPEPSPNIGLKDAEIERIRKDAGLKELSPPERESFNSNVKIAKSNKLDESALEIADRTLNTKESLSRPEHVGLVMKASKLIDDFDASIKTASELAEKGDDAARNIEFKRAQVFQDQLDKITEAADYANTEAGRDLSIRRMMINREDLSLAKIVQTVQAFKGRKLTFEETTKLSKMTEELKAKNLQLEELEKKHTALLQVQEKLKAERIIAYETKKTQIRERSAGAKEKIFAERTNIKKQLAAMGFKINDVTGVTAEASYLVGKLAVNYMREGAVNLDAVVSKIMADIPQLSKSDVYRAINSRDPKIQNRMRNETTRKISDMKTQARLLLEIENLEKGIFEPKKARVQQSSEIRLFKNRLNQLRNLAYKTVETSNGLEKAGKTINSLQDQLSQQFRNLRENKPIDQVELSGIKDKILELRKTMQTENILSDLENQLKSGEYKIKEKILAKPVPPELERAQIEVKIARKRIRAAIENAKPMTLGRGAKEGINLMRTLKTIGDMSATLRQGLVLSARHPMIASKAFSKAVKATFSQYSHEQIDNALRSAPTHYIRERSGLHLTEIGERLNTREEMFMSRLGEKIPVLGQIIKASERHMTTDLNILRAGVFDDFMAKFPNATNEELKAMANWINVATGRGDWAQAASVLSTVLFAPRFTFSRIQTPFMVFKYWKIPRVRNEIAKDYAALGGLGATVLALAKMGGAEVGDDPRSSEYGKIKMGNTRIDIWGGLQQPMRLIARIGLAATDKVGLTGQNLRLSEKKVDPIDLISNFASYKLAPGVTIPAELLRGKTMVGESITPSETAVNAVLPMVYQDIYDAYKKDAGRHMGLVAGLSFLGVGASTYGKKRYK